jgi:hypothetical protein
MAFGRMDVQHPYFLKLAPTLGRVTSSIPHGVLRFTFLKISFFPKLEYYYWKFLFYEKFRSQKIPQELLVLWKYSQPFFNVECI